MKQKFISIFILILLSACSSIAPAPTATALVLSTDTPLPTNPPTSAPTQTATPTENPVDSYKKIEEEYLTTLDPEQKAFYDQYNSKDRTEEGLTRRFLDGDFSTYLAYVDMNENSKDFGEVISVWNPEQQKPNPALLVGNNLLINENTETYMVPNPKHPNLDVTEERQLFKDYMTYVRANACALSRGVNLPNTLPEAITNPSAIKYLEEGCNVVLQRDFGKITGVYEFNVPQQNIYLDGHTGLVLKFVENPEENMSIIDKADGYLGMRFDQELNGPLVAKYYNEGEENLNRDPKLKHMLLASRITILFQNFFHRINSESDIDTLTQTNIYNEFSDKKEPLVIYSQIR